jgi:hypothetical protein
MNEMAINKKHIRSIFNFTHHVRIHTLSNNVVLILMYFNCISSLIVHKFKCGDNKETNLKKEIKRSI